jgi:release factor H-coupled RctB family protein
MNNITIISNEKNWIEYDAVIYLKKIANYIGMKKVIGLPDLHPGKVPVGAVFITEDVIYPHLIGCDIGCGMSFFDTGLKNNEIKIKKIVKKLEDEKLFKNININEELSDFEYSFNKKQIGSIGSGNHFAELQQIDKVYNQNLFNEFNLNKNNTYLLVHSGSRRFGYDTYEEYVVKKNCKNGFSRKSNEFKEYMSAHNIAVKWAKKNRDLIADKMSIIMKSKNMVKLIDSIHNSIEIDKVGSKDIYYHRKGAAPTFEKFIIIPGSRGALSYLVKATDKTSTSGYSVAHGAGRKWERSSCKGKLLKKYTKDSIKSTKFSSSVICNDNNLLFEEAAEAYKNIENVINVLVESNLIEVIATLKPFITYKNN